MVTAARFAFLDWPGPIAFAHQGGAAEFPGNTMKAFDGAIALGYRYRGVEGSAEMIAAARERLGDSVPLEVSLMEDYEPPEPVDMTLCLRA